MRRIAAIAWTLLILALCTIPGQSMPDLQIFTFDKLGHFGMFAGFACVWLWASNSQSNRVVLYVITVGVAFAIATEIYQGILPFGRQPSVLDALANIAGLLIGVWLYRLVAPDARRKAVIDSAGR